MMMIIVAAYALVAADAGEISADSFENFLDEIINYKLSYVNFLLILL